ncbi:hypothetical protein ACS0TY_028184 [Phlomoides rotata]
MHNFNENPLLEVIYCLPQNLGFVVRRMKKDLDLIITIFPNKDVDLYGLALKINVKVGSWNTVLFVDHIPLVRGKRRIIFGADE